MPKPKPSQESPSVPAVQAGKALADMSAKELVSSAYMLERIAKALPQVGMTPERFQAVIITAVNKNPKLLDCPPQSLAMSVLSLAQVGLEPDGRHAHLIPRFNKRSGQMECQAQLDYKGLVALVRRSGEVASIHADVVCENDEFLYDLGVIQAHKVDFKKPRGEPYAVYAMAVMKDGTRQATVMTMDEVTAIRKRSTSGDHGPWVTDFVEMAKKTAFRRLTKWLPLSYEAADAIRKDEETEFRKVVDIGSTGPAPMSAQALTTKLAVKPGKKAEKAPEPIDIDEPHDEDDARDAFDGDNKEADGDL